MLAPGRTAAARLLATGRGFPLGRWSSGLSTGEQGDPDLKAIQVTCLSVLLYWQLYVVDITMGSLYLR